HYSKEYKEHAIKRVRLGNESINAVALDLGLPGNGMLSNWIRSYKENVYNVVIKKKRRRIYEQEIVKRIRTAQARKRQVASPEFKAYCRKRISGAFAEAIKSGATSLINWSWNELTLNSVFPTI